MKTHLHILLLVVLFNASACSHQPDESKNVVTSSASEEIGMPNYEQLPALKKEALAGSTRAAMQLSLWYMKFPNGKDTDFYWTQIAAQNGSAAGQFNLGLKLLSDTSDPLNARYGHVTG